MWYYRNFDSFLIFDFIFVEMYVKIIIFVIKLYDVELALKMNLMIFYVFVLMLNFEGLCIFSLDALAYSYLWGDLGSSSHDARIAG